MEVPVYCASWWRAYSFQAIKPIIHLLKEVTFDKVGVDVIDEIVSVHRIWTSQFSAMMKIAATTTRTRFERRLCFLPTASCVAGVTIQRLFVNTARKKRLFPDDVAESQGDSFS